VLYFSRTLVNELLYSCPVYSFWLSSEIRYRGQASQFWASVGVIHALTWLLLAVASWAAPRSWQDQPASSAKEKLRWRERWDRWMYGDAQKRRALRRRLLAVNPIYWLASRVRIKPFGVWVFLAFLTSWWLFVLLRTPISAFDQFFGFTTMILLNSALKLWIGIEAGQRLAEEQKMGSLELLLSTPLTVQDILSGLLLSLRRQFLGPMLVVIAVELVLIFGMSRHEWRDRSSVLAFGMAGLTMLIVDIIALIWVAMASALTARTPNHGTIRTISLVLILPWALYGAIAVIVQLLWPMIGGVRPGWKFYLYLWLGLGILTDLAFGLPAAFRLFARFRRLALQRAIGK
jgi:hypothetical protein